MLALKKKQLREQRNQLNIMKTKEFMKTQSSLHQSSMHEAYVSSLQPHRHFAPVNVLKQPSLINQCLLHIINRNLSRFDPRVLSDRHRTNCKR